VRPFECRRFFEGEGSILGDCERWKLYLFVCLFVGMKPGKPYSSSCVGTEVKPLGMITHGQRYKPRACQRQRLKPRTCQSMVNTLQIDGLVRITGLTPETTSDASSVTERSPPIPCVTY